MAKGKARTTMLAHTSGLVEGSAGGSSWGFIYQTSTVQPSGYFVGDRVILPDGREFRLAKSSTVLNTSEACHFDQTGIIAYTAAVIAAAIGATTVVVPAATHAALATDELRGGYVTIFGSVSDGADMMFRGIVGNSVSVANAAVTLYLDGPLDVAVDTSSAYEVWQNPYQSLGHTTGSPTLGKVGPPAVYVDAADKYFWVQIRGPIFQNPQATLIENEGLGGNWRGDGSLDSVANALGATVPDVSTTQYAGYRMVGDAANNGPLFMLQG